MKRKALQAREIGHCAAHPFRRSLEFQMSISCPRRRPANPRSSRLGSAILSTIALAFTLVATADAQTCIAEEWIPGDPLVGTNAAVQSSFSWDPDGPGPRRTGFVYQGYFTRAGEHTAYQVFFDPETEQWSPLSDPSMGIFNVFKLADNMLYGSKSLDTPYEFYSDLYRLEGDRWIRIATPLALDWGTAPKPTGGMFARSYVWSQERGYVASILDWDGTTWTTLPGEFRNTVSMRVLENGDLIVMGTRVGEPFENGGLWRWNGRSWVFLTAISNLANIIPWDDDTFLVALADYRRGIFLWDGSQLITTPWGVDFPIVAAHRLSNGTLLLASNTGSVVQIQNGVMTPYLVARSILPNEGGVVFTIASNELNEISFAGRFDTLDGRRFGNVAVRQADGWAGDRPYLNGSITKIVPLRDGSSVVAGSFDSIGGIRARHIAILDGSTWRSLGEGINGTVHAIAELPDGSLLVGGAFTQAGGQPALNLARWDGRSWSQFAGGAGAPEDSAVLEILVGQFGPQAGQIIVGGRFSTIGGQAINHLAAWDGSSWTSLGANPQDDSEYAVNVTALAEAPDGTLYVGGRFRRIAGLHTQRIGARQNGVWRTLDQGLAASRVEGQISEMLLDRDGALVVVGNISDARYSPAIYNLARWNGSTWTRIADRVHQSLTWLTKLPNGNLVFRGPDQFNVTPRTRVTFLEWDGIRLSPLAFGVPYQIQTAAADNAGNILVSSYEDTRSFNPPAIFSRLMRTERSGSPPVIINQTRGEILACSNRPHELSVTVADPTGVTYQWFNDSKPISAASNPTAITPTLIINRTNRGRYLCEITHPCGTITSEPVVTSLPIYPQLCLDFDDGSGTGACDGVVNVDDLIHYLNLYFRGSYLADLDDGWGSGFQDYIVDVNDLLYFVRRLEQGC
jgi:hypothetical protein